MNRANNLSPEFYDTEEKRVLSNPDFKLISEIEQKISACFYSQEQFEFDPLEFEDTVAHFIPKEMAKKTSGLRFDRVDLSPAILRFPNEKELATIQKKIKEG